MRPTLVRYQILAATFLVALFMYVDRACLGQVSTDIQRELHLEPWQMSWVKWAFFFSYALAQVFSAAVAVRFGLRHTFAACLFLWSLFTVLTGLSGGFVVLILSRLLVGLTEAGAYPIAASLVRNWFPLRSRGFASSMIALGGRIGLALALLITPPLATALAGVGGWRATLGLFGLLGMGYAVVYWFLARDRAADHPRANVAEAALVPPSPPKAAEPFPLVPILLSRPLWFASLTQFCVNIGWGFIINSSGDYLEKGHGLTGAEKGFWGSLPGWAAIGGMFAGGFVTDALTRRLGLRWGRAVPVGAALLVCATACGVAANTDDYKLVVAMLCVMAAFVDVGTPAVWAFAQDVGGRHTGAALGWSNMWGNLGAGLSPLLLEEVQRGFAVEGVTTSGWPAAFAVCTVTFVIAAASSLGLNASRPLTKPVAPTSPSPGSS